jgi:hypothetical protein
VAATPPVKKGVSALDGEEAAALQGQIEVAAAGLDVALGGQRVDGGDLDAGADLGAVADGAQEDVAELDALALVADGVGIGEVVADDVEHLLVGAEPADAAEQGTHDVLLWVMVTWVFRRCGPGSARRRCCRP